MKKIFKFHNILLLTGLLALSSCQMDVPNINQPSGASVTETRDGIISLSVGLRQYYSTNGVAAAYYYPAVTARELKVVTTFTNSLELEAGGTELPTANGNILTLWSTMQRLMGMSEVIIENAPKTANLTGGTLSGIVAHAKLYKALALGALITSFERANLNTDPSGKAVFATREQVLEEIVKLLNEAITSVETTPITSDFTANVTGTKFDLINSLYAFAARYNLMAGKYAEAYRLANKVNLTSKSSFAYTTITPNPLWNNLTNLLYYNARENMGLPTGFLEANDLRKDFYIQSSVVNGQTILNLKGFATGQTAEIPVYLPDEMKLIKAEAILRDPANTSYTEAVNLINQVRTQTTGDPFGVHAGLPAYSGAVTKDALLLEVYKQRCAEMYVSGLRLEDSRRFGRPAPPANMTERNRNFYPYPDQERINNPNTPSDPAI